MLRQVLLAWGKEMLALGYVVGAMAFFQAKLNM